MNEGSTSQSALFITLALEAEARCTSGQPFDAVTSVVMAFMSVEAFVNEVGGFAAVLAKQDEKIRLWQQVSQGIGPAMSPKDESELCKYVAGRTRDADPAATTALASALTGKSRKPTEERYDLILSTIGAPPGFRGCEPRESLQCLTQLRNYLVHRQSDETALEMEGGGPLPDGWDLGKVVERYPVPTFAQYLQRKHLIPPATHPGTSPMDFTLLLCKGKLATWSCRVAIRAAREVERLLPESELRNRLRLYTLLGSGHIVRLDSNSNSSKGRA